ncbi:MAG: hypothetical protein AB1847_20535 [bacterium]
MATTFPQVSEKAKVYRVTNSTMDTARLQSMFGMNGKEVYNGSDCKVYRDKDNSLEIFNAGSFRYINEPELIRFEKNSVLPSKEEAINIASQFLIKNKILPTGAFVSGVYYDESYTAHKGIEGSTCFIPHMCVSFGIKINGEKVYGPGAKINVYIGDGGKIICLYKAWKEIEEVQAKNIITPQKALERLEKRSVVNSYWGGTTGCGDIQSIEIQNMALTYYIEPTEPDSPSQQPLLEPVYVFEGVVKGTTKEKKFFWKESALGE